VFVEELTLLRTVSDMADHSEPNKSHAKPTAVAATTNQVFTTIAPRIGPADAERIAYRYYGVEGSAEMLTSERDRNFCLTTADGSKYILKVANAAEATEVAEFQNRALLHIAKTAPDLAVPRVLPTLDGQYEIRVSLEAESHVLRFLTFLRGEPLYKAPSSCQQRHALGNYLARLGRALEGFTHPAADHEILWDLKHAAQLEELTGYIIEPARQRIVNDILMNFRENVAPLQPGFRAQVVHNDFNPHNVLVDETEHAVITGVLDFGDMVLTPLVNDVAVACSYLIAETGHPLSHIADFLTAYHARYPLLEREIDVLFDLIATRLAMTVTITEWRASRYPDNRDYILRNNPAAIRGIARFLEISRQDAQTFLRRVCAME
jgi:Ser/Thr protein kinase RdoA (MazF antagonist)